MSNGPSSRSRNTSAHRYRYIEEKHMDSSEGTAVEQLTAMAKKTCHRLAHNQGIEAELRNCTQGDTCRIFQQRSNSLASIKLSATTAGTPSRQRSARGPAQTWGRSGGQKPTTGTANTSRGNGKGEESVGYGSVSTLRYRNGYGDPSESTSIRRSCHLRGPSVSQPPAPVYPFSVF